MPRTARVSVGGLCYHVINRANGRRQIFRSPGDYGAFVSLVSSAHEHVEMRILAYCLMPNHFHFVLWPRNDRDLSRWMHWLLTSHVVRYHVAHGTTGRLWQGRFKAFPIQDDHHLITVLRYVERNPLRAGLVARAEEWPWSSIGRKQCLPTVPSPVARPCDWESWVNHPQTSAEIDAIRNSVKRSAPFGDPGWVSRAAKRLRLGSTLRPRGRPKKDGSTT